MLDPTKIVPEELGPVQRIGRLVLNRTPTNFFAETEQVAFHLGNLPPGIDVTNDPLLQGRLFSYVDTQLTRLAGPNFPQIPINRSHAPVNDMLRDGFHQHAVHAGVAPYRPNSLDGGNPFKAGDAEHAFVDIPETVAAAEPVPAPDALPGRGGSPMVDPRVLVLVDECWRQAKAKAIGAWGAGTTVLEATGLTDAHGVVTADSGREALTALQPLLAAHRVWERFPGSVA